MAVAAVVKILVEPVLEELEAAHRVRLVNIKVQQTQLELARVVHKLLVELLELNPLPMEQQVLLAQVVA